MEERGGGEVLFYQLFAKEGTNTDSGPRLSGGMKDKFATSLLSNQRSPKLM